MENLNLLVFPVVAGYYLLNRSYFFHFRQQRYHSQRLVFESIFSGTFIGIGTFFIKIVLECFWPNIFIRLYEFMPYKGQPYFYTSLSTIFVSIGLVRLGNILMKKPERIRKAIRQIGNELELLMESAFSNKSLLLFTLNNGKFYIAWVKELPIPFSNCISILPAISGYRDDKKELNFTTHYLSVYSEYIKKGKITALDQLKMNLIVDIKDIITVSNFDLEMYERFNPKEKISTTTKN